MATTKTSQNQRAYTRELLAMSVGGVSAGLVASGLSILAPEHLAPLTLMAFGAIMGLGANFLDKKGATSAFRLVLGIGAGVSMALLLGVNLLPAGIVGGALIGAAYSLEYGKLWERALICMAYAFAMAGGLFTADMLFGAGFLNGLLEVPVMGPIMQAGIWSIFLMLPAGLKYLQWESDEIVVEFRQARQGLDDKHTAALQNGEETYQRILEEIEREDDASVRTRSTDIAREVSRGLIELTRRSHELHERVGRTQMRPLEVRARELEARIRSAQDTVLKRELMAGLGEIVEQMRTRRRLEAAVARIEARQQRYLTALDRLHVTLVQNDSLSPSEGALSHSLDELSRLTDEVHWKNLSVDELVEDPFDELESSDEEVDEEVMELLSELNSLTGAAAGLPRVHMPPAKPQTEVVIMSAQEEDEQVVLSHGIDGTLMGCEEEPESAEVQEEVDHVEHVNHSR